MQLRPLLALPLALGVLACDEQTEAEPAFRSDSDLSAEVVTLEYEVDLPPVLVTSYQLGAAAEEAFAAAGFDALLEGAGEPLDEGFLSVRLEGVHPLSGGPYFDGRFLVARAAGQAAEVPVVASRFGISIDGVQSATTEVFFTTPDDVDPEDFAVWQDSYGAAPPPPAPVESIQYELVGADGNTTVCTADITHPIQIDYEHHGAEKAEIEVTIADACVEILEAAASDSPPEAFFVRCDPGTTTAARKIPGLHKISDITLKRGVINATGEPAEDLGAF